jgi:hypothetical protein
MINVSEELTASFNMVIIQCNIPRENHPESTTLSLLVLNHENFCSCDSIFSVILATG